MNEDFFYKINVTLVVDPLNFWARIGSAEESLGFINQLEERISKYCEARYAGATNVCDLQEEQLVLVSVGNGFWQRARVASIDRTDDAVDVMYVDHGTTEVVSSSVIITEVPKAVQDWPDQAYHCKLAGVEPIAKNMWVDRAVKRFRNLVLEQTLDAKLNKPGRPLVVEVFIEKENKMDSVSNVLIREGLAQSVDNSPDIIPETKVPSFELTRLTATKSNNSKQHIEEDQSKEISIEQEIFCQGIDKSAPQWEKSDLTIGLGKDYMPNISHDVVDDIRTMISQTESTHAQLMSELEDSDSGRKPVRRSKGRGRGAARNNPDLSLSPVGPRLHKNIRPSGKVHMSEQFSHGHSDSELLSSLSRRKEFKVPFNCDVEELLNSDIKFEKKPSKEHRESHSTEDAMLKPHTDSPDTRNVPSPDPSPSVHELKKSENISYDRDKKAFSEDIKQWIDSCVSLDIVNDVIRSLFDFVCPEVSTLGGGMPSPELYLYIDAIIAKAVAEESFIQIACVLCNTFREAEQFSTHLTSCMWQHWMKLLNFTQGGSTRLHFNYTSFLAQLFLSGKDWRESTLSSFTVCLTNIIQQWQPADVIKDEVELVIKAECLLKFLNEAGSEVELSQRPLIKDMMKCIRHFIVSDRPMRRSKEAYLEVLLYIERHWNSRVALPQASSVKDQATVETIIEEPAMVIGVSSDSESEETESSSEEVSDEEDDEYSRVKLMLSKLRLDDLLPVFEDNALRDTVLEIDAFEDLKEILKECGVKAGHIMDIKKYLKTNKVELATSAGDGDVLRKKPKSSKGNTESKSSRKNSKELSGSFKAEVKTKSSKKIESSKSFVSSTTKVSSKKKVTIEEPRVPILKRSSVSPVNKDGVKTPPEYSSEPCVEQVEPVFSGKQENSAEEHVLSGKQEHSSSVKEPSDSQHTAASKRPTGTPRKKPNFRSFHSMATDWIGPSPATDSTVRVNVPQGPPQPVTWASITKKSLAGNTSNVNENSLTGSSNGEPPEEAYFPDNSTEDSEEGFMATKTKSKPVAGSSTFGRENWRMSCIICGQTSHKTFNCPDKDKKFFIS